MTTLEDQLLALEIQRATAAPADTRELRNALWRRLHAEGWKHADQSDKGFGAGPHDSDHTLLRAFLDGSDRAFQMLVDRHGGVIETYARRSLPSAEAEEVVQEVMMVLFRRAQELVADPRELRPYLFRTAQLVIRNRLRDRFYEETKAISFAREPGPGETDPLSALLVDEKQSRLVEALQKECNPLEQSVVLMMLKGQSQVDIAQELQLTDGHVRQLKHRASIKLSAALTGDANHDP